jgi:benzil reductase ((S)-benzoin forming)
MEKKQLFIITGTSRGLGKSLAELILALPETKVVGVSRSKASLQHANYQHFCLDFSEVQQVIQFLPNLFPKGQYQRICLINNAGWLGEVNTLGNLAPQNLQKIMNINVVVPVLLMNHFVQLFEHEKEIERMIINISSGAADKAIDGWSGYCASKAALNRFTLVAQKEAEVHQTGIRFFSIAPGLVDTSMQEEIRNTSHSHFSLLEEFVKYKNEGQLQTPHQAALKILQVIQNPDKFESVLQDVRNFNQ